MDFEQILNSELQSSHPQNGVRVTQHGWYDDDVR